MSSSTTVAAPTTTAAGAAGTTTAAGAAGTTTADPSEYCRTTHWYILLGASAGAYALVLLLLPALRVLAKPSDLEQSQRRRGAQIRVSPLTRIHLQCQALMKGANALGKVMLALNTACVIVSFVLYILLTYRFTDSQPAASRTLLVCFTTSQQPILHIDFGLNMYYCVIFVLRLLSSESLLSFWLSMDTLADTLTIIPSVIMYATNRHLIAFQFMRLFGLRFVTDVLIYFSILRTDKYIRLTQLLIQIITIWAVSAGLFQLIEVVGDFWRYSEGLSAAAFYQYHDCFYFMLITMSTVGYGDISPNTVIGKFFIILFICVALGLFTSILPEVSDILSENKKYKKNVVHLKGGKKHVVVIANFTPNLLKTFFADFFHSERAQQRQFLALLGTEEPDLEVKALLKKKDLYTTYLQGSVMNVHDLRRVCVKEAACVIILADSLAKDMEDEDMKNIMRVIAIKDFCPTVQVLVQLQLYRSKTYLRNIPDWSGEYGDEAVCVNEIKYGLLAQNCMVPGLSTLLCNLLMLRTCDGSRLPPESWQANYLHGVEFEFYRVPFSQHFDNFTFLEAAEVCLEELGITLLAVEVTDHGCSRTVINPGSELRIRSETMLAFVVASDEAEASLVTGLRAQSKGGHSLGRFRRRKLVGAAPTDDSRLPAVADSPANGKVEDIHLNNVGEGSHELAVTSHDQGTHFVQDAAASEAVDQTQPQLQLDSSGYFHYSPNRSIDDVTLSPSRRHSFSGHLIVCILEKDDICINLTSFLMPLRASSIRASRVKDIVFVGRVELVKSEWSVIQNFPRIHVLDGSPLNRANLKSVNIESCHSCLILSPKTADAEAGAQLDRETVLCTLNIKTMKNSGGRSLGDCIHITTELNTEEAIAYLDQDDESDGDEAYMTQAFATGRTFFLSLLGSLITTIYFNPAALSFLRSIVTTVDSDEFEMDLNEQGFHFMRSDHGHTCQTYPHGRSQIELLPVSKGPLAGIFAAKTPILWKHFALRVLRQLEVVCIGLSRLQVPREDAKNHRFVITVPPDSLVVWDSDMVYCLTPPKSPL